MKHIRSKILMISDSYEPLVDATSQINNSIVKMLSKNNEVTIACSKSIISKEPFILKKSSNLLVLRVPVPFLLAKKTFPKIIKFITYSSLIIFYILLKKNSRNLYIIHSTPPILIPIFSLLLATRNLFTNRRKKIILLAHDLYPDILEEKQNNNLLYKFMMFILRYFYGLSYRQFDLIITCAESIKYRLGEHHKVDQSKIKVIYNWSLIPSDQIKQIKTSTIENDKDINNVKLLLIGNIGKLHIPMYTSYVLKKLLKINRNLKLSMYTRGSHSTTLYKDLKSTDRVVLEKLVPPKDLVKIYKKRIITIVPISQKAAQCAFPSRIATAMSLGSPILLITDSEINNCVVNFIKEKDIGLVISKGNTEHDFNRIIEKLIANYNNYRIKSIETYSQEFSKEIGLSRISELINKIN